MALLFRSSTTKLYILRPLTQTSRVLFQLPPALRHRCFHASPKSQFLAGAIETSHFALESLHSVTGLPWVYTLPLFALSLRTILILPLSIYIRSSQRRQISLNPLILSWRHSLERSTMREVGHLGPIVAHRTLLQKMRWKRNELYKRFGCQPWKNFLTLLQLPVFLTVMEALRKMCGWREGWLGILMGERKADMTAEATPGVITGDGLVSSLDMQIPVETSLVAEGALWFPSLLIPDPQIVLPFLLSGFMLLNIFGHKSTVLGKWQLRLRRGLGLTALVAGPLLMNVPSALLVYWISSSALAYGQAVLLDWYMPIKIPVEPCKPKKPMKPIRLGLEESQQTRE